MAWHIHRNVIRGEIDNRERGRVCGRIWLHSLAEPILLDLTGNAAPDLAGCLLEFENSNESLPLGSTGLAALQKGTVGDLTASRKVWVSDLPEEEELEPQEQNMTVARHMANCLYLEWFSEENGRVVIESTHFKLTISAPAWSLSPEEEQARQQLAGESFASFMAKLSEHLNMPVQTDKEWDEFDYEKLLQESDARAEIYRELLDKYKDDPDRDRIVARQMGWEKEPDPDTPEGSSSEVEEEAEDGGLVENEDLADELEPDPLTEGVDWVLDENNRPRHPLAIRASQGAVGLWQFCNKLGLSADEKNDVSDLLFFYQMIAAKLAGALDVLAYGRDTVDPAFTVACLKRVLPHVQTTLGALEKTSQTNYLPEQKIVETRGELFALREEILRLMQEFRNA